MLEVVGYYLCFTIFIIQPIEEIHNCNNPNTIGNYPHIFCEWSDKDFIEYPDGKRRLRPKRKVDNVVKAYYRKRYYERRYMEKN